MTTVYDIFQYLKKNGEEVLWHGGEDSFFKEVRGINTDQEAICGDLAWISPKHAKSDLQRLQNFDGSLLIGPQNVLAEGVPLLASENPKLAFIQVITHFFSEQSLITWPTDGKQVANGSIVSEDVILPTGVVIGSNTVIEPKVVIGPNTVIANCTIKSGTSIGANCSIGLPGFGYEPDKTGRYWRFPHIGRVVIEEDVEIGSNTCIDRGSIGNTVIHRGARIDNLVHVAHNVIIKSNSVVIANSMLGGSVTLEEGTWIAPSVSVMNQAQVGKNAVLGLGAVVLKNVEEDSIMVGNPAKLLRKISR